MANQEGPATYVETGRPLEIILRDLDDEELAEELDRMVSNNYCGKRYMPSKWIEAYTSEAVVKSILRSRYKPSLVPDLISYVLHSPAKKLLLLLALCQALHCLPAMKDFELNDDYLPVAIIRKPSTKGLIQKLSEHEGGKEDFPNPLMRGAFERNQWLFLAPVFTEDEFHHELHSDTPLPFLPIEPNPQPKLGGFSTVLEVHVDTSHQLVTTTYGQPNSSKAALKDLRVGLENYEREKKALEKIRNIENPHLVKPIASLKLADKSGYFLFPWAEGGNLWNFWGNESNRDGVIKSGDYPKILWTLKQIHGLCHALVALHNEEDKISGKRPVFGGANTDYGRIGDENGRHGDIKPDNILVFYKAGNPHDIVLCIADVGLGKFHAKTTQMRMEGNEITDTKTGTSRYLPPEFDMKTNKQISRLHDVWSLGCVYLEFVVWALWGEHGLKTLQSSTFNQFWQGTNKQKQLHQEVKTWISTITNTLSSVDGPTALLDLVQLVGSDMLQLKMSRKRSKDILPKLREIRRKAESDERYCFNPTIQQKATRPINSSHSNLLGLPVTLPEDMNKLEDVWESSSDNNFANCLNKILRDKAIAEVPSTSSVTPGLCSECLTMDFCKPSLRFVMQIKRSETCQLCSLLYQACKTLGYGDGHEDNVEIYRKGPKLDVHDEPSDLPILSLYMHPDFTQSPASDSDIQLGTPDLPEDGSIHQIELFKEWIRTCEESHNHSRSSPDTQFLISNTVNNISTTSQLVDPPTRLIDVRGGLGDNVRLISGKEMQSPIFFALSHRWGDKDEHQVGCTLPSNVKDRFNGISLIELPRNFQEAIKITKAMGVRYLWIDSVCIIQTDSDDWKREAVRMEQVYSNASCVLAASSSNSSIEGFLKSSRMKRPYVSVKSPSGRSVYVCKDIDNFHTDVERSILNSRGWVLQERALARRIIHFTKNQAYFECGNGVHCESLIKLNKYTHLLPPRYLGSGKATLLGDSNFPRSAESFHKTGKIVIMQNLYKQYSALAFKFFEDRPVGISGLERRLTSAYDTRGGYGILEAYLERSLLWKRDEAKFLERIRFPSGRSLPSWSWMAYSGTITYVEVGFNEVDWTNEYVSPFASLTQSNNKQHWEATGEHRLPALKVSKVRRLNTGSNLDQVLAKISFDVAGGECATRDLRCVVLGRRKKTMGTTPLPCYVLMVKSGIDPNTVVRIGAGMLLEHDICWDLYESKNLD
ncbi:unnamed protein product [Clonostachys solani]|uniref:Protein kinase domain-containing protein n=1 Tax=Clonostachys solani TaxID=160281 RepID=A0A9N9Z0Q6_9HYPO|nr:unnamed protein product [Clonostachys solani]